MDTLNELVIQIELHSVEGIKECFANGISPNAIFDGKPLIYTMIEMYTRTPRFKDCVKLFVDNGLEFDDKVLLAVLLDDAQSLKKYILHDPALIHKKYSLNNAYTQMMDVSLLHICAEYNHVACAEVLVNYQMSVNITAGTDKYGFGGQTPIFHTVNQNLNNSKDMLEYLLVKGADLTTTVKGIIWGKGYEWETLIPAVNPISYAMMGLLPQVHRNETTISKVVSILLKHAYGIDYTPVNVPCKYLKK